MSNQNSNTGSLTETMVAISANFFDAAINHNNSVAKFSSDLHVRPICFIDSRLNTLPETYEFVSGALVFFSSCYISSALLLSNTKMTSAMANIDRLNPSRKIAWSRIVKDASSDIAKNSDLIKKVSDFSGESHDLAIELFPKTEMDKFKEATSEESKSFVDGDKRIEESQPLSIGKRIILNVEGDAYTVEKDEIDTDKPRTVQDANKEKAKEVRKDQYELPIQIRFESWIMSSNMLTDFMTVGGFDKRASSLFRAYMSDTINISELFTLTHITKAKKKLLMMDTKGRIKEVFDRKRKNFAKSVGTGKSSLGTVANTLIISDRTRKEAELRLGYRLSNPSARENFMDGTSTMILIIVDEESEMTTMYVHGYENGSDIPFSEYKKSSKKDSSNITDIVNAFKAGNNSGF